MLTLYDAARCPYCARVRIVLAEKAVPYETVIVDLDERPSWIYDLNASGRVPVLDDDGLLLERFDENLGDAYYGLRREPSSDSARDALEAALDALDDVVARQPYLSGREYGLADCAYVPWLFRAEAGLGLDVRARPGLAAWLERLEERPAIAAERALVGAAQQ